MIEYQKIQADKTEINVHNCLMPSIKEFERLNKEEVQ